MKSFMSTLHNNSDDLLATLNVPQFIKVCLEKFTPEPQQWEKQLSCTNLKIMDERENTCIVLMILNDRQKLHNTEHKTSKLN